MSFYHYGLKIFNMSTFMTWDWRRSNVQLSGLRPSRDVAERSKFRTATAGWDKLHNHFTGNHGAEGFPNMTEHFKSRCCWKITHTAVPLSGLSPHAGKYAKLLCRVSSRENLKAPKTKAASNQEFDVRRNFVSSIMSAWRRAKNKLSAHAQALSESKHKFAVFSFTTHF